MPRLPEITERDRLPEDKRDHFDYLLKTRGAVRGGFAVLLHSPEVAGRFAHVGTYIRFESSLPRRVAELAALTTSTLLENEYEVAAHQRGAREAGVDEATLGAVTSGGAIDALSDEDRLPVRAARELVQDHRLSDAAFAEAQKRYGDQGAVDLVGTIAYYGSLAYLHNAMEIKP
jgi:4-carboxymuconolactone decarboxylase